MLSVPSSLPDAVWGMGLYISWRWVSVLVGTVNLGLEVTRQKLQVGQGMIIVCSTVPVQTAANSRPSMQCSHERGRQFCHKSYSRGIAQMTMETWTNFQANSLPKKRCDQTHLTTNGLPPKPEPHTQMGRAKPAVHISQANTILNAPRTLMSFVNIP